MVYETMTIRGKEIKLDRFLKKKLDFALLQQKKKFDIVFIIDGNEGGGKSTLSFICGWYLAKGKITMNNLAEGTGDAIAKLHNLPDKSVLIIDEGSLMFSSRDAMRSENRQLLKILNVIRQKLMILIVVAPTFFELEKYLAYRRSNFLLHVYVDKKTGRRGKFMYFGSKNKRKLYILGKKNYGSYAKPRSNFVGPFPDFKLPFDEEYQKLKKKSLMEVFNQKKKDKIEITPTIRRTVLKEHIARYLSNGNNLTLDQLASAYGVSLTSIKGYLRDVRASQG